MPFPDDPFWCDWLDGWLARCNCPLSMPEDEPTLAFALQSDGARRKDVLDAAHGSLQP